MLQIYLFGEKEEGYLDINPGTTLEVEALADIFDEDFSAGDYSLPVEFPWTDNNKRLMGFSERLENFSQKSYYWRCHVYDDRLPEMLNAKLTLLEKSGKFSYKRGKFNASISGTKGLYGTLIRNKKLKDLQLGGLISWTGKDSRTFATELMKGLDPDHAYIAFAPVAIESFIDTERPDYVDEFLAKDTVNTVVVSGSSWNFGRPKSTDTSQAASPGNSEYIDFRTVPFFRLKYVFRKCFEEFGYTVSGGFLQDSSLDDLCIYNHHSLENYAYSIYQDFQNRIFPGNHMPDLLISEFIKAVCDFFCCQISFSMNEVRLRFRKTNFTERKVLSINNIIAADFESTLPAVNNNSAGSGYKIAYTWDSEDQYYSDRVKDLSDKTLVATVGTVASLASISIGRQLTTDDIAFVEADNSYYVVADATTTPVVWDIYAERLDEYTSGDGERSVDINLSTLCTAVKLNSTTGLNEKLPYVATRQKGNYINKKGIQVKNPFGLRLFYISMLPVNGVTIPVSYNHNRNSDNVSIKPYSLSLQGEQGLAKSFHTQWQDFKERAEIVKTRVLIDQKVMTELQGYNCYEVNSVLFFPYQMNKTIPANKDMEIRVVPL